LLATEAIPLATGLEPPVMVYLPQQCLIQEWRLLQQWLRQRDRSLGQKQQLDEAALLWQNSSLKDQKQYLLTGQNLKEAIKIQANDRQGKSSFDSTPMSQVAEVFIQASLRSRQSDRLKLTALIGFIPLILLIILGFYLYRQSQFQGYWNVVKENQDQRESQPRIKALETLNQMGESLSNQNFNQINLQNINLSKANLSNSNFVESFLTGANLKGANLSKANLSQTELTGANLTGANLSQGKLVNSYLTGANLSKSNLSQANLTQANLMRSNFNQANLESANLNKAELTGANLTQTNLQKSRFQKANLWGVDLSNANLENADFSLADLTRVNFSGVKLKGIKLKEANLTNADFSAASVLPLAEIKTACFWQTATFTEEIKQQLMALKTTFSPNCQAPK
ncbi:MAG: pentapeptide repeat-containing protein, partial [Microcystaceae cyanobacterium]